MVGFVVFYKLQSIISSYMYHNQFISSLCCKKFKVSIKSHINLLHAVSTNFNTIIGPNFSNFDKGRAPGVMFLEY